MTIGLLSEFLRWDDKALTLPRKFHGNGRNRDQELET